NPEYKLDVTGTIQASAFRLNGDIITDFTGTGLTTSGGALQLALLNSSVGSGSTASFSGLEFVSGNLTMLQGCSEGQILKWDEVASQWRCANDSGATSAIINVQENGTPIGTDVDTLNFLS